GCEEVGWWGARRGERGSFECVEAVGRPGRMLSLGSGDPGGICKWRCSQYSALAISSSRRRETRLCPCSYCQIVALVTPTAAANSASEILACFRSSLNRRARS